MDARDLYNLFNEQKDLEKYVTKDLVTDDPDVRQGAHTTNVTFACKTFTNQLLQWGEGFLIFKGHLERAGAGNWADDVVVGIQNGTNTLFTSVKVSMNDTEVEHNRTADLGTFVNLLEVFTRLCIVNKHRKWFCKRYSDNTRRRQQPKLSYKSFSCWDD